MAEPPEERRRAIGDPQLLVEKIVRLRIRDSLYWKEHCFGLTADRLVDRAVELTCVGGVSSETNKPTPFLCLLLRMLAIVPR
jgi:pre-mRNA-splicing factor 38A